MLGFESSVPAVVAIFFLRLQPGDRIVGEEYHLCVVI